MYEYIFFFIAAVSAGMTWTLSGYVAEWRKHHKDPDWQGFDLKSLRDDTILGGVLGIAVVILQPVSVALGSGYDIPTIENFPTFATAVFGLYGTVAIVDKWLVGFVAGK